MKVLDVPSTGKRGVVVGQGGRYGQVSRTLAIPANPRTTAQLAVRQSLSTQAKIWRTLTQAQIAAWNTAAAAQQTTPEDGQSGRMTGLQLFVQVNTVATLTGQATVTSPPAPPLPCACRPLATLLTPWRFKHNTRTFQAPFTDLSTSFEAGCQPVLRPFPALFKFLPRPFHAHSQHL